MTQYHDTQVAHSHDQALLGQHSERGPSYLFIATHPDPQSFTEVGFEDLF